MAIGAHPDDIEIFMFGLLSVLKKKGEKIHCIVATDGGKGGTNLENLANVRKKETTLALKNLSEITFLELPDGELGEEYLREFQDNEKSTPTILTTSSKLSTGVDALDIRNIVLMRIRMYFLIIES